MPRIAFFDVDNTLTRGSTLYFLGRGMYNRGFFNKRDVGAWVLANIRFRMTGTEKSEVIERFQNSGALGTRAETKDGNYTGNLIGNLLHGKEKARAVLDLVNSRNIEIKDCFAYSDSHNDLPLLESVGHPNAINPDAKLRIISFSSGWPVHDFRRLRWLNRFIGPLVSRLAGFWTYLTVRNK